ncbi:DUF885 domain-containing protein [Hyphococcus sp.]|uniref:DUF885 domain-containing protein n=1 Tax=Hyphococcus sp. TaxID=2038636 RepID=UPI003CCBBF7A
MRIFRKQIAAGAGLCALLAAGSCGDRSSPVENSAPVADELDNVETEPADPSEAFLAMAERHSILWLEQNPESASDLGVSEEIAGAGYNARLGGYGFEAHQNMRALNEQFLQELRSYNRSALTDTAATTYDVLKNAYDTAARRNQFDFGGAAPAGGAVPAVGAGWAITPYFVTQLTGLHLTLPQLLTTGQPLETRADAEAYIARMNEFGRAFDEAIETIGADAALGVVPPRFVINGVIASLEGFAQTAPADNPLIVTLNEKLANVEGLSAEDRADFTERATQALTANVYPAYQRLTAAMEQLLAQSDDTPGVWRLGEEGEAYYQFALNAYGAGGMTGEDIHELGLSEVERITAEMDAILKAEGLAQGSVAERMEIISARPESVFANNDQGREELLSMLREQINAVMAVAPQWFNVLPEQSVEVRRIPVYEQDSSPGAYYSPGPIDGSRPGNYWINLKSTADNPKFSLRTLTHHEAVPGHHFQTSLQRSIDDMPLIRNMLSYSEFSEGWALYGEQLAKEMGMYEGDPLGDLGRLQAEIFRAARLVVDSGMHHKRWSREQAIDYMVAATGETRASVTREIERYAAVPAQACSYKLGMIRIGAFRAKAEAELGEAFDIREFHDQVLLSGSMPMQVLERKIDAWIESKKGA